ncbi:hypothetical protein FRC02_002822 [Tulasnella sp. 418]|nr:hypothetical protein FRC02_002822 [Tulasnella sp. 418]
MRSPFCDHCGNIFHKIAWKCLQCPLFSLCSHCHENTEITGFHDSNFPTKHTYSQEIGAEFSNQNTCNGCGCSISGPQYRCVSCPDYDLCNKCFGSHGILAHNHDFVKLSGTEDIYWNGIPRQYMNVELLSPDARCTCCKDNLGSGPQFMCMGKDCEFREQSICGNCDASPNHIHDPSHAVIKMRLPTSLYARDCSEMFQAVFCGICREIIVGERHKCIDCHDFDLCNKCLINSRDQHDSNHRFLEVERHCDSCNTAIIDISYKCVTCSPVSEYHLCSYCSYDDSNFHVLTHELLMITRTSTNTRPAPHVVDPVSKHIGVACGICGVKNIKGIRMMCLDCPSFDTCIVCFEGTPRTHPTHRFAKVTSPDNIKHASDTAIVPHQAARCHVCQKGIIGSWFKCVHPTCRDFNLCPDCEALPFSIHPTSHLLLKMKQPISPFAIRDVSNIARTMVYGVSNTDTGDIKQTSTATTIASRTNNISATRLPRLELLRFLDSSKNENRAESHHHTLILERQATYKLIFAIMQTVGGGIVAIPKGRAGVIAWLSKLPTLWNTVQKYHQAKKARERAGFKKSLPLTFMDAIPIAAVTLASSLGIKLGSASDHLKIKGEDSDKSLGDFLGGFMNGIRTNLAGHGKLISSEVARGQSLIEDVSKGTSGDAYGPDSKDVTGSLSAFYEANGADANFVDHVATAVANADNTNGPSQKQLLTEEEGEILGDKASGLVMDKAIRKLAAKRRLKINS